MIGQRTWIEPTSRFIDQAILAACDDDPLIAQILVSRGFGDPDRIRPFLNPDYYTPSPPEVIPDLAAASELLQQTIKAAQRVLIWGDFDVDGQTATALLVDGMKRLGADAAFYLPKRATESHGIKLRSLEQQIAEYKPDILLTCDTGITEFEAVDYARSVGLPVIITDHHELGPELPAAAAVVNPKRLPPGHPLETLPGVGVAYKLIQHLYTSLGHERELPRLLDLVALGIVCDVVMQVNDTRYLLQTGLDRLRHTERIGLNALMEVAALAPEGLTAEQIGFQLGPRLNAAGRMGDASVAVELLTTHDRARAYVIAQQMEGWNNERKLISRQIESAAEDLLARDRSLLDYEALVLYQPDWHAGMLGPVANRLVERYHRPVLLLTGAQDIAYGSARSVAGYDIHAALAAQGDLLRTMGGHAGAAGLSLDVTQVDVLRRRLSRTLASMGAAPGVSEAPPLDIDLVLALEDLEPGLVYHLERLSPFGEGNLPPVLATKNVHLSHAGIIGREKRHQKLVVENENGQMLQVLWWDSVGQEVPGGRFDVAYTLAVDDRGELEATLVDYRGYAEEVIEVEVAPSLRVEDWRREDDPASRLREILAETPDALVWAEAYSRHEHPAWKRRAELVPASTLVIFTTPSDPGALDAALLAVQPQTIHVLAVEPPLGGFEPFLRQLVVAARNAIDHRGGQVAFDMLCGATAQSPQVIRTGLDFLAANGQIGVEWLNDESAQLTTGNGQPVDKTSLRFALGKLKRAFEEVEAYRHFFRIMPIKRLIPHT